MICPTCLRPLDVLPAKTAFAVPSHAAVPLVVSCVPPLAQFGAAAAVPIQTFTIPLHAGA